MKFILNKDKITIEEKEKPNSGSIMYYEVPVEYDESWERLTIKAILVETEAETGRSVSLIDNKIYIDNDMEGSYRIGFVGYTIENGEKTYQISTDLKNVTFNRGAGQIETEEQDVPTPTEWEIYLAQMQAIVGQINGLAEDLTEQVNDIQTKLDNGDFDGADGITPTIGQNGNWYLGEEDTGKPSRGENGTNGTNGTDGYSPIANVTPTSGGATISITDKNGTTTANVLNGTNGTNGTNGVDGYSPTASVTQTSGGATISITDKNGTTTASVTNGTNRYKWN